MVKIKGIEIIGYFIWWTIREVKIRRDDLVALLQATGMKHLPKQPKPFSTFLKAVAKVQSTHRSEGLLIRKIKKLKDEYVFGLVDERVAIGEHLEYSHTATLRFNPKTGSIQCDNVNHAAYSLVVQYYMDFVEYMDSDDIRDVLFHILDDVHSLSVRQRGGIYFIPVAFEQMVDQLEKIINSLGKECYMAIAPQIDEEKTKKSIYKAFLESLKEKIAMFKANLESNFADIAVDAGDQRHLNSVAARKKSALVTRLKEFKQMKQEIEFYADALDFQAVNLREELEGLATQIRMKLDG